MTRALRQTIAADPFPMVPRLAPFEAILANIEPPPGDPPQVPPLPKG